MPEGAEAVQPGAEGDSVCVAVHVRPLIASELEQGSTASCIAVAPGHPQVQTGQHNFTYDHVFGGDYGQPSGTLYTTCVAPLVESLFKGYNATVFAYGQTGSGKTYTMGSEFRPGGTRTSGVIPEAISAIFGRIKQIEPEWQCSVRVSFVEIHKEEVRDLLYANSGGPRPVVSIREMGGGVCLCGATEIGVSSEQEMAALLETGTLCRATASTNMNNRSSRSHAIFTITLEQKRHVQQGQNGHLEDSPGPARGGDNDDDEEGEGAHRGGDATEESYLCAKMHLVDLAGSERAKRTKAVGERLKEGSHINRGLLALGNVINAIVDKKSHIPYRDSKLTRLLQDSLGGNSKTVMIACVSPADINFEESLNTLRYADRARHIRNRPTVNRDPVAAQVAQLRQQISALKGEVNMLRAKLASQGRRDSAGGAMGGGGNDPFTALALPPGGPHWAIVDDLQHENTTLELENTRLKLQLEEVTKELSTVKEQSYLAQATIERLTAEVRSLREARDGAAAASSDLTDDTATVPASLHDELVAGYVARIASLERDLRLARQLPGVRRRHPAQHASRQLSSVSEDNGAPHTPLVGLLATPQSPMDTTSPDQMGHLDHDDDADVSSMSALLRSPGGGAMGGHTNEGGGGEDMDPVEEEEEFYAEMAAHQLEQEKMRQELTALQRLLESKEKRISELQSGSGQVPALKQHYDRVLSDLQKERDTLMADRASIMQKLQHIQAASEEERRRLESAYKEKLAAMDEKLRTLRHKEREFVSMQKLKQRTEDLCKRLSAEVSRIKSQKVQIQKMMETNAKQFASWRSNRERELTQLRKQAQRSAAQIQALEAMQAKQNAVLQRKIADANAARKKLRELQGSSGAAHANAAQRESVSRAANGSSADNPPEIQPNAAAPLLRTERARRDWLEKELDLCNQSYEYRRVIEGEVAQRAEATRQLKNVMKRLMITSHLTPASPLTSNPACATPMGYNQVGEEVSSKLNERRSHLEKQITNHNCQIAELQAAWERAKTEEEVRGAGASDARRWNLIRNAVESRELLKTLFRIAGEYKANSADRELEYNKLSEENDLLKLQLDFARKETDQQRKRAAAAEARAASALSTPFTTTLAATVAMTSRPDDTDREVDDLLQQLELAKTPSGLAKVHDTTAQGVQEALLRAAPPQAPPAAATADGGRVAGADGSNGGRVASPDGSVEVSVSNRGSGGSSTVSVLGGGGVGGGVLRPHTHTQDALTQGVGVPTKDEGRGGHVGRGKAAGSKQANGRHHQGSDDDVVMVDASDPESESSSDDDDVYEERDDSRDADYMPDTAVHVNKTQRVTRRRSGSVPADGAAQASGVSSRSSSGGGAVMPHTDEEKVLQHMNQARALKHLPPHNKLTVNVLKDELKSAVESGWRLADGATWTAGKKIRAELVRDYEQYMWCLERDHPTHTSHTATSALTHPSHTDSHRDTTGLLSGPASLPAVRTSNASKPLAGHSAAATAGAGGDAALRDYRAAIVSAAAGAAAVTPPRRATDGAFGSPGESGQTYDSDISMATTPNSTAALTPMSQLYLQKASEARQRIQDMKQSFPTRPITSAGGSSSGTGSLANAGTGPSAAARGQSPALNQPRAASAGGSAAAFPGAGAGLPPTVTTTRGAPRPTSPHMDDGFGGGARGSPMSTSNTPRGNATLGNSERRMDPLRVSAGSPMQGGSGSGRGKEKPSDRVGVWK